MVRTFISNTFFIFSISVFITACSNPSAEKSDAQALSLNSNVSANNTKVDSSVDQKSLLTKMYVQAINDYLHAVYKSDKIVFDTLYFGKHVYGQDDDFPDITLPDKIESTYIRLVSPEFGMKMQKEKHSLIYINMMGWVEKEKADFILIAFSNGGEHKFDCTINYTSNGKEYNLESFRLEYFNKEGKVVRMISNVHGKFMRNN